MEILFPYGETRGNEPLKRDLPAEQGDWQVCYYQTLIPLDIDAAIGSIGMC